MLYQRNTFCGLRDRSSGQSWNDCCLRISPICLLPAGLSLCKYLGANDECHWVDKHTSRTTVSVDHCLPGIRSRSGSRISLHGQIEWPSAALRRTAGQNTQIAWNRRCSINEWFDFFRTSSRWDTNSSFIFRGVYRVTPTPRKPKQKSKNKQTNYERVC